MNECSRCGVSEDRGKLHDAISAKGIVKICEYCASMENFPIVKKPVIDNQIPQRPTLVRDRLSRMNRPSIVGEISLRGLIDKDLKARKMQNHPDLIDNFHWTIQRIRRARKITREQFAKGIDEPESKVRMIEQGFLPENDYKIINKIEGYFRVNLRKPGTSGFPNTDIPKKYILDNSLIAEKEPPKKLSFPVTKQLKISDLREIKKKYEEDEKHQGSPYINPSFKKQENKKEKNNSIDSWEEEYSQDDEKFLDEEFREEE